MPTHETKPVNPEKCPVVMLNEIDRLRDALQGCGDLEFADLAKVPDDMLREAANHLCDMRDLAGNMHERIACEIANNELAEIAMGKPEKSACGLHKQAQPAGSVLESGSKTEEGAVAEKKSAVVNSLEYVHDSWVAECEAAGVYSRTPPPYGYSEQPAITATLTPGELRILVQRHLNSSLEWDEFFAWNGLAEGAWEARAMIHEVRFKTLVELLPPGDQQRLQQQLEIRQQYIQSVRAEVARCEMAEGDFWARADAGLVCEAEIAAHRTPPFIMGAPVMPPPADGGPGPERWNVFASEE